MLCDQENASVIHEMEDSGKIGFPFKCFLQKHFLQEFIFVGNYLAQNNNHKNLNSSKFSSSTVDLVMQG